ncbi:MAG: hypothetical protein IKL06_08480 [Lachnospiraceae bacterium]|nr:hypothetical protein [Lachnospiraceae bacterium]
MHKKIKQLAYATFDDSEQDLSFSVERVELELIEGRDGTGEFIVSGTNGEKLRGVVYTTNPRMECMTPSFEGEEVHVRYQFHSEGLVEGDVRKGEFVIVCEQGEYNLSFVVSISKIYADTSIGKIKSLTDFVRLARESFTEAYQVFYSSNFPCLREMGEKECMLYEAIRKEAPTMQALEAYLVEIGRKPAVNVYLEQENGIFTGVTSDRKEQLELKKDNWGYLNCEVTTDADFIRLSKTSLTTEDFLGSTCFYEYYIDAKALHAGRNYGRICFVFSETTLTCEVCADGMVEGTVSNVIKHRQYLGYRTKLMQYYMDYRTKKIVTGVWARNSIELLDHLLDEEPENDLYRLMKAQAFLVNKQKQEASWILEAYKRSCIDRTTPEWGYYLYLCTLMEREESYVNRLAAQIEELFQMNPDSSLLCWILLFMREDYYKNSSHRLKAIEAWVEKGCDSPFFYLEAFYLYWQDPYLLTKLGSFEIKVLNWACKQEVISKEIAAQILTLIPVVRHYDEKVFRILEACYEVKHDEETVAAICSYLINGQKFSKEYHSWYVLGIEHEVRITNLYEAYLLSADKESIEQVPKVIFMYFQYHNSLSYKQLALLYAFIIRNKDKYKKVYQNYLRTMEQFAMSQIEAGHMDENLAVVYREMLPLDILNVQLAEKLPNVLFVHKLKVTEEKQFSRAIIVQKTVKQHQIVPVINGTAYFKAYSEDYCILLQDTKGQFFADESLFEEEALLEADIYLDMAMKLAPMAVPYLVYLFDKKQKENYFSPEDGESFSILMDAKEVKEEWKALLEPAFVRYFATKNSENSIEKCLKEARYHLMTVEDRRFMLEQLIEHHIFEQAYELLHTYGYDAIGSAYRVAICSERITTYDYVEEDFLLGLAADTFFAGKYNDVILSYLCRYYNGPTRQMELIWKAADEFEIDTFDLEERIVTQMLYSTDFVEEIDAIYEAYCKKGGKELIFMAYLSYFSHLYLLKDAVVSEQVFLQLEHRIVLHQEVMDVQKYALLKYYAGLDMLSDVQFKIADELLLEYICQNRYFAFYKEMDERLVRKYQLQDKCFVTYQTIPGTRVEISYYMDDEKLHEEEMMEVYEGIFVKEFVLFFGDKLSYYISERDEQDGRNITESGQLENFDRNMDDGQGCYPMLNNMLKSAALQEEDNLQKQMQEYRSKKYSTERLFKLL